jgi:peptidoglycan/xylan/chitin deacetylase (PgdA/CDA1 family)
MYLRKIPHFLANLFPQYLWYVSTQEKILYLTFDDGPVVNVSDFVLTELEKYKAKATFFMLGKQAAQNPTLTQEIHAAGHSIGNHSYSHLNGWKTKNELYFQDIQRAQEVLADTLGFSPRFFRPPYGKITFSQGRELSTYYKVVIMDILCGDFDATQSAEKCTQIIQNQAENGSIIVFHDSLQAANRMKISLPQVLAHFTEKGYQFHSLKNIF